MTAAEAFHTLPDLAARLIGGSVIWANDELFAQRQNLIKPGDAEYSPHTFGHTGQMYDGWETRRRRDDGHDAAIVRLGAPGIIHGAVVDTSWFRGNYPTSISLEGANVPGYPTVEEVLAADWTELVSQSTAYGDTKNDYSVSDRHTYTHVRLSIYPDGGVARLRVHGVARPDPDLLDLGPVDLAALENGAAVSGCSNRFYSSPDNLLLPGRGRTMGEGWETARRRTGGNDWVAVRLAAHGVVHMAELDTTHFLGNAPGEASLSGRDGNGPWFELMPRTRLQPDTRHRFPIDVDTPVTEVRMDVYPDGGMLRMRLWGELTEQGRAALR
ncbi:MAG: allantoicase [Gordonia sp. (in: high G+C Gram-positive bacteria)]|uniref:allantoicase n=1 Tax=Gordonia sp. (in: high G+C Gram-positive bacteria) TaxID=84139 RepID=UPI0039E3B214